jgi:hypothetical protein
MKSLFFSAAIAAMSIALLAAVCLPHSALAQARPLSDRGRSHGYVTWPVYCDIAKCNDQRQKYLDKMNGRSQPQVQSSKTGHCDSVCRAKCQATWRRGNLPSVEACYVKWAKLSANGTARQCEAAHHAGGQPKIPGC